MEINKRAETLLFSKNNEMESEHPSTTYGEFEEVNGQDLKDLMKMFPHEVRKSFFKHKKAYKDGTLIKVSSEEIKQKSEDYLNGIIGVKPPQIQWELDDNDVECDRNDTDSRPCSHPRYS